MATLNSVRGGERGQDSSRRAELGVQVGDERGQGWGVRGEDRENWVPLEYVP